MDLPGEYLFNLSIIAMTFTAVSALVMLLRQSMGGKLSNFDIYLITAYVSGGFTIAMDAVLPPLVSIFEPPPEMLWSIASGLAAVFSALFLVSIIRRRHKTAGVSTPTLVRIDFTFQWMAILLLVANAAVPTLRGGALFAAALTFSLTDVMWSFVCRIASLLGDRPSEDWDPRRG